MVKEIVITTYNRLPYLQKCLWSIIASSKPPYRIIVCDDASRDGTREFLELMKKRGLVEVIFREENKGTAVNFNELIDNVIGDWFVMANDDMYFHRGWEQVYDIKDQYPNAGIVSFYNYSRLSIDEDNEKVSDSLWKVSRTGLGSALVYKPTYKKAGKFQLGGLMGYFTTPFCVKFSQQNKRNEIYATIPAHATNMDLPNTPMNERDVLEDYSEHRKKWKR